MRVYKTINTFTQCPSPAQIASYIIFLMQILVFYIIIQNRLQSPITRIALLITYSICVAVHIVFTLIVSISDPSDSFMIRYRNNRDTYIPQIYRPRVKNSEIGHMLYCDLCRSYVDLSSRHCRSCARCVQQFDHHCMWINNCVGGKNYRMFLVMIGASFVSMLVYIVGVGMLWGQQGWQGYVAEMGVVWATGIIVLVFTVLILNLILLHAYLNYLGLTTYEFIMMNKKKRQEEEVRAKEQEMTQEGIVGGKESKENGIKEIVDVEDQLKKKGSSEELIIEASNLKHQSQSQTSQKKLQKKQTSAQNPRSLKVHPDGIFANCKDNEQQHISQASDRESLRISSYFNRNKSLSILVSSDVMIPERNKEQVFPKTCQNQVEKRNKK